MIRSFKGKIAHAIGAGRRPREFPLSLMSVTERKLQMIESAAALSDLRIPPGNRLESLQGGRKGQHSIRINDQWRICFRWSNAGAEDVEIVDYH